MRLWKFFQFVYFSEQTKPNIIQIVINFSGLFFLSPASHSESHLLVMKKLKRQNCRRGFISRGLIIRKTKHVLKTSQVECNACCSPLRVRCRSSFPRSCSSRRLITCTAHVASYYFNHRGLCDLIITTQFALRFPHVWLTDMSRKCHPPPSVLRRPLLRSTVYLFAVRKICSKKQIFRVMTLIKSNVRKIVKQSRFSKCQSSLNVHVTKIIWCLAAEIY